MTRGLMIAAPRSGSGKTTLTLGLLRAFRRRGVAAVGLKSGPDYIDPAFHAAASGVGGRQSQFLGDAAAPLAQRSQRGRWRAKTSRFAKRRWACSTARPAAPGRSGASADVAAALAMPVLLVLDVSGQAQSAAAIAKGCATYDDRLKIAGVVLNRVGSERHRRLVGEAIEALGLPIVGALPRNEAMALPERHLGLVQAAETHALQARLETIADFVEAHVDCEALLALASDMRLDAAGGAADRLAAAGAADRARARRGVFVHLSASRSRMAGGGRRDHSVLAACGRAAAGVIATSAGCLGAIRNCTRASSRRRPDS